MSQMLSSQYETPKASHPDCSNSQTKCRTFDKAECSYKKTKRVKPSTPTTNKVRKSSKRKLFSKEKTENEENVNFNYSSCEPVSNTPVEKVIPISERQQLALLLQLSSSDCENQIVSYPKREDDWPNLTCRQGKRPISLEARHLLKRNKRGETPLHLAAIKGNLNLVKQLLRRGADVSAKDFAGWTVLHEACNHGFYHIAQHLLKIGADANAKGYKNFTPLHDASANGHSTVVKLLLQYGGDPTLKNSDFQTAIDLAANNEVLRVIQKHTDSENQFQLHCDFLQRAPLSESSQAIGSSEHTTSICLPTMRKNSPQNQAYKGAEKPTSPRLTLRFQSIKTKDDKNPAAGSSSSSSKANDVSSSQPKYQTYCVTMETRDYETKKEDYSVSSSQTNTAVATVAPSSSFASEPVSSSCSGSVSSNNVVKDSEKAEKKDALWNKLISEEESVPLSKSAEKVDSSESSSAKSNPGNGMASISRVPSVTTSEPMDYKSDEEKDETRRKRRKSSDSPASKSVAPNSSITPRPVHRGSVSNAISRNLGADVISSQTDHSCPPVLPLQSVPQRTSGGSPKSLTSLPATSTPQKKKSPSSNPESPQNDKEDADKKAPTASPNSTAEGPSQAAVAVVPTVQSASSSASTPQTGSPNAAGSPHSPKVPPLKIVLGGLNSNAGISDVTENRERNKVSSSKPLLPYVISAPAEDGTSGTGGESFNVVNSSLSEEGTPLKDIKDGSKGFSESSSSSSGGSTNNTPSKSKEEERFQRVTRSSQRMQAALASASGGNGNEGSSGVASSSTKNEHSGESSTDEHNQTSTPSASSDLHPRKRKLRTRDNNNASTNVDASLNNPSSSSSSSSSSSCQSSSAGDDQQLLVNGPNSAQPQPLLNCYQMFLNIRKQVDKRRKNMVVVYPKPPQGFKDYLLNRCSYVLEGNAASRISVPTIPPPQTLSPLMKNLFIQQEKERYKLRLQHLIEREKLVLSAEQEILRVHGRAARAMANQTVPLSACSILKDEEIYNLNELEQDDKDKNVRSRYNGRLFLSWLQDVDDKWEKIKEATLLRHHNESESLNAVQKLDWEWKMKELAMCEVKSTPVIDDIYVPMVHVSDDFDLLPA